MHVIFCLCNHTIVSELRCKPMFCENWRLSLILCGLQTSVLLWELQTSVLLWELQAECFIVCSKYAASDNCSWACTRDWMRLNKIIECKQRTVNWQTYSSYLLCSFLRYAALKHKLANISFNYDFENTILNSRVCTWWLDLCVSATVETFFVLEIFL